MFAKLRPWLNRAAVGGGTFAVGVIAFPHMEDTYWHYKDPHRVWNQDTNASEDDDESESKNKKQLVILGTGWASVSVLKHLDRDKYKVTVVSPRNYFLFTPLLPSVCSGTVTDGAVTVPIRTFTSYKALPIWDRMGFMWRGYLPDRIRYIYAAASDIDLDRKVVQCDYWGSDMTAPSGKGSSGPKRSFEIPYDMLVLGTGATTNTFNTEGVDKYCHFLKETGDATLIRQAILERLELASLPKLSDEKRRELLSFWVVGGGPTAVEFAAELQDFLMDDVVSPKHATFSRCAGLTSVNLVQSNKDVLPGYPKVIRDFSYKHLKEIGINLLTEARAKKVTSDLISVYDKPSKTTKEFPYGLVVWATGVKPGPLIQKLIYKLPQQHSYRTLKTDPRCQVIGAEGIFALGDCADIDFLAVSQNELTVLFDQVNLQYPGRVNHQLSKEGTEAFLDRLKDILSTAVSAPGAKIVHHLNDAYLQAKEKHEIDDAPFQGFTKDVVMGIVKKHFARQKFLPPTAQVAHQQGEYLARNVLNNPSITQDHSKDTKWTFDHVDGFEFKNMGQLVYVGGHMAALSVPGPEKDIDVSWNGSLTNFVWHAAYFGMLESVATRCELLFDWSRSYIFGRSTALGAICSTDSSKHVDSLARRGNTGEPPKKNLLARWLGM